jgi:hypothetical protein
MDASGCGSDKPVRLDGLGGIARSDFSRIGRGL